MLQPVLRLLVDAFSSHVIAFLAINSVRHIFVCRLYLRGKEDLAGTLQSNAIMSDE